MDTQARHWRSAISFADQVQTEMLLVVLHLSAANILEAHITTSATTLFLSAAVSHNGGVPHQHARGTTLLEAQCLNSHNCFAPTLQSLPEVRHQHRIGRDALVPPPCPQQGLRAPESLQVRDCGAAPRDLPHRVHMNRPLGRRPCGRRTSLCSVHHNVRTSNHPFLVEGMQGAAQTH